MGDTDTNLRVNSFGGEDGNENVEEMEMESRTKKTNGGGSSSDSEGENSGNVKVMVSSSSGVKRRAGGGIASTSRHYRSVSMDCCFMEKLSFCDESSSSLKLHPTKVSPTNSADEKLAEIVMTDPKRVKRILANRVSAARSKERKTRYMAELEHKVQTLQTEATTLSAQLTHLQRDSMGLTNQNSELKFHLQAMEQQAKLRDALSEKLTEEVQRLKMVTGEPSQRQGVSSSRRSESNISKTSLNQEMFQKLSISQMQHTNQNRTMKPNE